METGSPEIKAESTSDDIAFDFLELPKELRLCMYGYLIKPARIKVYSYDFSSVLGLTNNQIAARAFYAEPFDKTLSPEILRTCKTVYDEAEAMLYAPIVLHLCPSLGGIADKSYDRPINVTKLKRIRRLHEIQLELATIPGSEDEDIAHSFALSKCLHPDIHCQKA